MNPKGRKRADAEPDVARAASAIADPVRAQMLLALLDGGEMTASDLASRSSASAQSASAHLAKLVDAGLLRAAASGRHRLFRLASADVARALESLAAISGPVHVTALAQGERLQRLREARSCYDHLAGRLGVALADALVHRKALKLDGGDFSLGRKGETIFADLGVDLSELRANRRSFARACLDWTERRPHVAGSLGASLLDAFLRSKWLLRRPGERALLLTPEGRAQFLRRLQVSP